MDMEIELNTIGSGNGNAIARIIIRKTIILTLGVSVGDGNKKYWSRNDVCKWLHSLLNDNQK